MKGFTPEFILFSSLATNIKLEWILKIPLSYLLYAGSKVGGIFCYSLMLFRGIVSSPYQVNQADDENQHQHTYSDK
jgi:hypothetical protein